MSVPVWHSNAVTSQSDPVKTNDRIQFNDNFDSVEMKTKRKSDTELVNIAELQLLEDLQHGMKQDAR